MITVTSVDLGEEMTEADLAKKLLAQLRHVTNPTPAKLLAEFRRR
jgi:hypothetical protein